MVVFLKLLQMKVFCKALTIKNISIIITFTIVTISVKAAVSHTKFDWRHQDLTLYGHHGHHRRCESPASVVSHSCDGTKFDWRHQDLSHRLSLDPPLPHPLYRHTVRPCSALQCIWEHIL